jgi:DNA-binding NarL/FixJ family response regulator
VLQIFAHKPGGHSVEKEALTKREVDILNLLVKGKSYKMIAGELALSVETIRSHIKNIYRKLQVHSASGAVAVALNEKLV